MGSAWAAFQPGVTEAIDQLDESFDRVNLTLMEHQRDFHFADESLIAPGGAAQARVVVGSDGPRLQVGAMAYRLVIVPPGLTLAHTTVDLLDEFVRAGGRLVAVAPLPTLIDARPAGRPVLPAEALTIDPADLASTLDALLPWDVSIPGQPTLWAHHRRIDGLDCYFLANIDPDHSRIAAVHLARRRTG